MFAACVIRIEPPDAFTTTVEVSAENVPCDVSRDWTVIVLPFAISVPPLPTVTVVEVIGKLEPVVVRVVPAPPEIVIVFATSPRPIVKRTADAPLSNTTVPNSDPPRLAPAKVSVWDEVALNVTVAVPADQEAEAESFVQLPEMVQFPDPKAMYEEAEETLTFPPIDVFPDVEIKEPPDKVRFPRTVRA